MTKWPQFITKDLGPDDDDELMRRWEVYNRDMQAIIAAGGVHQDDGGWWVDDTTGELIGPDPEMERPSTDADLTKTRPFAEVFPELAESIRRGRGRPAVDNPKQVVSIRLDPDVIAKFKATGKGWQSRINEVLKQAKIG